MPPTDIEIVQTALVEFDKVAAGLAQLETNYKGVLFDVETSGGMAVAKAARAALREPRYKIERIRKEAKAPLLAVGKKLDADAARITAEIMKLEDPIDQQIKSEEDRQEREKQAKIDAENARIAGITARIEAIRNMPVSATGKSPDEVKAILDRAVMIDIDASFAEFESQASSARAAAVVALSGIHAERVAFVAEQARIAAEREELAKLRAEQERRDTAERARIAEDERVARVAREAEQARQQEELRRQREQLDQQRAEQEKAQQLERDRLAAEVRQQREATEREEARLAAEREQLRKDQEAAKPNPPVAATTRPSDEQIAAVVAEYFGVDAKVACQWLAEFGMERAA
jgi:colicin import membrane protein